MHNARVNLTPAQRYPATATDASTALATPSSATTTTATSSSSSSKTHYALKQVIGKGAYGIVYKAVNRQTRKEVAIKVIEYDNEEELNDHMLEIDLLKNLRHPNIVKYHGFIQKRHQLCILLEYCSRGSLRDVFKQHPIDEQQARVYVQQTLQGLQYLHSQGVIHRDIKAANLLLDAQNTVKLADFGVSTRVNSLAMTYAGSPNWMSPEVMLGKGATTVSDVWSLGATVVEILTGNPPFHNLVNEAACYAIVNDVYYPPAWLSRPCCDFIHRCFQKNMFKRPSATELLKHAWVGQTHEDKLEKYREEDDGERWEKDFIEVDVSPSKADEEPDTQDGRRHLDCFRRRAAFLPDRVFEECAAEEIAWAMLAVLEQGCLDGLSELLAYDAAHTSCRVRRAFVSLGGLPLLLDCKDPDMEELLLTFFTDNTAELIRCGVLLHCKHLKNRELILHVAAEFGKLVTPAAWGEWCSTLPGFIDAVIHGLRSRPRSPSLAKKSQTILLQLSASPSEHLQLYRLMSLPLESDPDLMYVVFKSFNNHLQHKELAYYGDSMPVSGTLGAPDGSPSPLASVSLYPARSDLPDGFISWLLKYTPTLQAQAQAQAHVQDVHVLKNFVRLCYNSAHLNRAALREILEHRGPVALTASLLQQYIADRRKKHLRPVLSICLSLCVELSSELSVSALYGLVDVAVRFLGLGAFVAGGVEILLNCLNFALHETGVEAVCDGRDAIIAGARLAQRIRIPAEVVVQAFYREDAEHFGNYITKLTRLISLPPCRPLAYEIVIQPLFMEKLRSVFDIYRGSLIIQIDFLKFLKMALTRFVEHVPQTNAARASAITTEALISHAIRSETIPAAVAVVPQVTEFLKRNWQDHDAQEKVGSDSILIRQLCNDIEQLQLESTSPATTLGGRIDNDGFAVPRVVLP